MRRWLAIVLLVLLPLQFTWAATAIYCGHETDVSTKHMGHHEHKHQASSPAEGKLFSADAPGTDSPAPGADHADCGLCHLSCAKSFASATRALIAEASHPLAMPVPHKFTSHLRERIERPNWQRVA